MLKRKWTILLVGIFFLTFAGTAWSGVLSDIVDRGELRVAVQSGAAPYAFMNKEGKATGAMVEIAREMANRMGVKLKVLDYDWDGLIPAILSGKADILAADMTPTLKRALKLTFCDPWYYVQPAAFTKADAAFKTLEDINKPEVTVGVLLGSTGENTAKKFLPNAKIKSYKGGGRMIVQAIIAGHVDAGVNDDLAVLTVLPDFPPNSIRLLDKRLGEGKDPLAFAMRPDAVNLWQWTNLFFENIRADGFYKEQMRYWMESTDWKKDNE